MKTCIKCNTTKQLSLFHKHKGMKDGHLNKCAECVVKDVASWNVKKSASNMNQFFVAGY